ncbi:Small-conductance mechanosensitive channel [Halanaeroarchaeum sp. HSR-CO]|uniref:mechanosensitive ion channel family protein n=1 Tax=Halanaeroarchaeum sp. HSR-CO TaxID=2866382 RepID=UPI00217E4F89|nr:mechanosensitive ion channel family protein [Halanaeroarchaeum sp. HSR-CO]UWG46873.1 Small-conductance mechanosensitive channel [Halanaeroarchaeum sp. HSR-CO]
MIATVGPFALVAGVVRAVDTFVASVLEALPSIMAAVAFLLVAAVGITGIRALTRRAIDATLPSEEDLVVDLGVLVVTIFLWFGAVLVVLDILGMGEIAASLGTATGFIALGISYALSNVVADTVSGVYLLRDPDFEVGDQVTTASVTGTVASIGLRKTRLETDDGERVVLANADVDEKWRRLDSAPIVDEMD